MNTIDIFIVDDEQSAIDSLTSLLSTFFNDINIIGTATSAKEAYAEITSLKPHLVFLDIEMGAESGFQLLERFEEVDFMVVFVTAHVEFALQAIKFSALDYIIKPAGINELKSLFEKVRKHPTVESESMKIKHMFGNFLTENKQEHKITLPVSDGYEFIKINEILYLRADGSYTVFSLKDGTQIISSKNLKYFEGLLVEYGFYRIHNSTIISLKYIKKVSKTLNGHVIMEDHSEWGISRSRKDGFYKIMNIR